MVERRPALRRVGRAAARPAREMVFARLRCDGARPRANAGREDSGGRAAKGSYMERGEEEAMNGMARSIELSARVRVCGVKLWRELFTRATARFFRHSAYSTARMSKRFTRRCDERNDPPH